MLSETSESVINKIEKEENTEALFDEIEKLDDALTDTQEINLDNLMDEEIREKTPVEKKDAKFDFDEDFEGDFEFKENKATTPEKKPSEKAEEQSVLPNKKKRNRKRNKKNNETQAS